MNPRVLYISPFCAKSGYGRAAADYASCMKKAGIEFRIKSLDANGDTDDLEERYRHLLPNLILDDRSMQEHYAEFQPTHVIVHSIPQHCHDFVTDDLTPPPGVKKIALTTWETNALPSLAVEVLTRHFDRIWVPSEWNCKVFRDSWIPTEKLQIAYHSFDPEFWWREPVWNKPIEPYTFYTVAEWNERKNPIGLLKAYWAADLGPSAVLKIVCKAYHEASVAALARAMDLPRLGAVEWITDRLDESGLYELHKNAHCFVSLARGEGWGLGPFEASIMGNAVIYSDYSGHQTFMRYAARKYPIETMSTPVLDARLERPVKWAGLKIPATAEITGFGFQGNQCWGEPNLAQAITAMRTAFEAREGVGAGSFQDFPSREALERKFGYEAVGRQIRAALDAV